MWVKHYHSPIMKRKRPEIFKKSNFINEIYYECNTYKWYNPKTNSKIRQHLNKVKIDLSKIGKCKIMIDDKHCCL